MFSYNFTPVAFSLFKHIRNGEDIDISIHEINAMSCAFGSGIDVAEGINIGLNIGLAVVIMLGSLAIITLISSVASHVYNKTAAGIKRRRRPSIRRYSHF